MDIKGHHNNVVFLLSNRNWDVRQNKVSGWGGGAAPIAPPPFLGLAKTPLLQN